ncbi:hypothetical protein EBU99_09545 [bacterium]|nr:hypothetical protein [bacterium]
MKKHLHRLLGCAVALMLIGCDGRNPPTPDVVISAPQPSEPQQSEPNLNSPGQAPGFDQVTECSEPRTASVLPAIVENENPTQPKFSFDELKSEIDAACSGCHLAPAAKTGGFWYVSALNSAEVRSNGQKVVVGGIAEQAEWMLRVLSSNQMPPQSMRKAAPQKYTTLQAHLEDWLSAGKPSGSFTVRGSTNDQSKGQLKQQSDIGSCIPRSDQIGADPERDEFFAAATELPARLSQTDLMTLDSLELARRGTLSYNVEYPLWADNAEKGRYIHLPSVWNEAAQKWKPAGYKAVARKSGETVFRKIETRLIVVRKSPQEPLLGSYKWNENESEATLVTLPYRDGTPWKDDIFKIKIDESTGKMRKYAIPGKQRCVECHKGSEDFVLGFTPLQLNRRPVGAAGRERAVGEDELTQIQRFLDVGVLRNVSSADQLPKLEESGNQPARNVHEMRLQGYMVGNCAHCHNPNGFAMKDNKVQLDLREGQLFNFDLRRITRDSTRQSPKYFAKPGEPELSQIYQRVAASKIGDGGRFLPMPMHTPGDANCKLLNLTSKWIYSLSGNPNVAARAETEPVTCVANDDFNWVDLDMTWPQSSAYAPRRADWKDETNGMPKRFAELQADPNLSKLLRTQVPVDFWDRVSNAQGKPTAKCDFPPRNAPRKALAWMLDSSGKMKQPAGELYMVTPGAHFYNTTCAKCHGSIADGRSGLATNLLTLSGGSIRVANLKDGLFGAGNFSQFDVSDRRGRKRNLAGNYLIWMAMEGTRVQFPPEMEPYVGRHKAQMLNQLRERCRNFITTSPQKATERMKDFAAFKDICFFNNGKPTDKQLQFDPNTDLPINTAAQDAWADTAAINVGWAIFDYLKNEGSAGKWQPAKNECEKIYPLKPAGE